MTKMKYCESKRQTRHKQFFWDEILGVRRCFLPLRLSFDMTSAFSQFVFGLNHDYLRVMKRFSLHARPNPNNQKESQHG